MQAWLLAHKKVFERTAQAAIFAALLSPLIVMPNSFIFPFITAKVWFFQIAVTLATAAFLVLCVIDRSYRPRAQPFLIVAAVFVGVLFLSAFLGVDTHRSLWANHERMTGVITILHYAVFFVVSAGVLRGRGFWGWRGFWQIFMGAGAFVLLFAAIQHWYPAFLFGGLRAASTLGNPIYLGLHAAYVGFLSVYFLWEQYLRGVRGSLDRWRVFFWLVCLALSMAGFVFSETRGVFVGVGAALLWIVAVAAVTAGRKMIRRGAVAVLLAITLFAAAVAFAPSVPAVKTSLERIPLMNRFADLSFTSTTNANRLFAWRVALNAWRERPFFGWGPFTYHYVFNEKFSARQMVRNIGFGETWFDNAHNFYLDTLATQGIFGLLAYLFLLGTPVALLARRYAQGRIPAHALSLLGGVVVMHAAQNVFAFEQPTSYLSFFAVYGFVHAMTREDASAQVAQRGAVRASNAGVAAAVIVIAVAAAFAVYRVNVRPMLANRTMFRAGLVLAQTQDASAWLALNQKALAFNAPFSNHIREEMARSVLMMEVPADQVGPQLARLLHFVLDELETASALQPREAVYHMLRGQLWYRAYRWMPNEFSAGVELGGAAFLRAIELSPERLQFYALWAQEGRAVGRTLEGRDLLRKARALAPSSVLGLRAYGEYLVSAGIYRDEGLKNRLIAARLVPWHFDFVEYELFITDLMAAGMLDDASRLAHNVIHCYEPDKVPGECPWFGERSRDYPSYALFAMLIALEQQRGNMEAVERYLPAARYYYPDFMPAIITDSIER